MQVGALAALGFSAFCYVTGENLPVGLLPVISTSLRTSLTKPRTVSNCICPSGRVCICAPHIPDSPHILPLIAFCLVIFFAMANLAAAAAPTYSWLLAARVLAALSHAVFWSTAPVVAAGLFSFEKRGWAVGGVFAGIPIAMLLGVPTGTWIGQQAGWRVSFVVLSCLALAGGAAVALVVPLT